MRDEMANLAWAIERTLENPVEQSLPRTDATERADSAADSGGTPPDEASLPRYLLSTTVPGHWIPLLPVQLKTDSDEIVSRLRRGAVLQPDGSQKINRALGHILRRRSQLTI